MGGSVTMNLVRVRLAASAVSFLGGVLAVALFLTALFSRHHEFGAAALIALIASMLGTALAEGLRAYVLFKSGSWITLDGRRAFREEQPAKFATWVGLRAVFATVWCATAGFLAWTIIAPHF